MLPVTMEMKNELERKQTWAIGCPSLYLRVFKGIGAIIMHCVIPEPRGNNLTMQHTINGYINAPPATEPVNNGN